MCCLAAHAMTGITAEAEADVCLSSEPHLHVCRARMMCLVPKRQRSHQRASAKRRARGQARWQSLKQKSCLHWGRLLMRRVTSWSRCWASARCAHA